MHRDRTDVADELRACLEAEDGRTLIEMRESEPHYTVEVERAEHGGEGTTVSFDQGLTTYLAGREIKVGDRLTIWDGSDQPTLGGERHGWAHNGELIEWLTPFERIAKRVAWLAKYDRDRRERLERGAEKRATDYAALPAPLKARIDRLVAERPDFWLNGDYELFCCTEAAKFAQAARDAVATGADADAVDEFWARDDRKPGSVWDHDPGTPEVRWLLWAWALSSAAYDYDCERQRAVLGADDGHSGNTFGGACALARALLAGERV